MDEQLGQHFALDGRIAVVTGAASGIGLETARVLALAGARVVLADLNEKGLADAAASIAGASHSHVVDVTHREAVDSLAEATLQREGKIDVWVNCAGTTMYQRVLELTEADVDRLVSINLKGSMWGCIAAGRAMERQGSGSIVNMSSTAADTFPMQICGYAITKAAVNALTRTSAKEFGAFGVRVNAVAPGWTDTPLANATFRKPSGEIDPELREQGIKVRAASSPLGITGVPRDIALAVLYLASDASRFVTGQILRPNGGSSMT